MPTRGQDHTCDLSLPSQKAHQAGLVASLQMRNLRLGRSHSWGMTEPGDQTLSQAWERQGSQGPGTHRVERLGRRLLWAGRAQGWALPGWLLTWSLHLFLQGRESEKTVRAGDEWLPPLSPSLHRPTTGKHGRLS